MKQIIQDLKSGETILEEVPAPIVKKGTVMIHTHRSLVSLGTERMLVEFGKAIVLRIRFNRYSSKLRMTNLE